MTEGENVEDAPTAADYSRVGARVRARRKELGLTQNDVQGRGGPSTATLRQIENGSPADYRRGTTRPLEQILGWSEGSIERDLYFGQTPVPVVSLSGSGSLTTLAPPRAPRPDVRWNALEPPADTTFQDARETVLDYERDFSRAAAEAEDWIRLLQHALAGTLPDEDPAEITQHIASEVDKMVLFDQGRRYWQRQVDLLRREGDLGVAAHRGRKSQVEAPEPHAE